MAKHAVFLLNGTGKAGSRFHGAVWQVAKDTVPSLNEVSYQATSVDKRYGIMSYAATEYFEGLLNLR